MHACAGTDLQIAIKKEQKKELADQYTTAAALLANPTHKKTQVTPAVPQLSLAAIALAHQDTTLTMAALAAHKDGTLTVDEVKPKTD